MCDAKCEKHDHYEEYHQGDYFHANLLWVGELKGDFRHSSSYGSNLEVVQTAARKHISSGFEEHSLNIGIFHGDMTRGNTCEMVQLSMDLRCHW
jgi:hypothetical protein